jgi:hypothetical protein
MSLSDDLRNVEYLTEQLCREVHDRYEAAASATGWETNPASRVKWADVPEANKATMRAALGPVADRLAYIAELEADFLKVTGILAGVGTLYTEDDALQAIGLLSSVQATFEEELGRELGESWE